MNERHWEDIGYNFVIGEDGNAYTGRGWDNAGAHARSYNNRSIGICIIGNFMSKFFHFALLLYYVIPSLGNRLNKFFLIRMTSLSLSLSLSLSFTP